MTDELPLGLEWQPGVRQDITHKLNAAVPRFDGLNHLWIIASIWQVQPSTDGTVLDHENLMSMTGPVCLYCEQDWAPDLHPVCKGSTA